VCKATDPHSIPHQEKSEVLDTVVVLRSRNALARHSPADRHGDCCAGSRATGEIGADLNRRVVSGVRTETLVARAAFGWLRLATSRLAAAPPCNTNVAFEFQPGYRSTSGCK
jgi:hypothetical protein